MLHRGLVENKLFEVKFRLLFSAVLLSQAFCPQHRSWNTPFANIWIWMNRDVFVAALISVCQCRIPYSAQFQTPFRAVHHRLLSRWCLQFDWPSFSHPVSHSDSFCYRLVNIVAYGACLQQLIKTMKPSQHSTCHTGIPILLHPKRPKHSAQHYSSCNISPVVCIEYTHHGQQQAVMPLWSLRPEITVCQPGSKGFP